MNAKCYSRIQDKDNSRMIVDCSNKVYGKLKDKSTNKWINYCRSCYSFQLKNNKDNWIDKRIKK